MASSSNIVQPNPDETSHGVISPQMDLPSSLEEQVKVPKGAEINKDSNDEVLDVDPISFRLPKGSSSSILLGLAGQLARSMRATRQATIFDCEREIIVKLTSEELVTFITKLDEERFAKTNTNELISSGYSTLSLSERLDGWRYSKRKRAGIQNRWDKFYYHKKSSNKMFRSVVEVITFVVCGAYPRRIKSKQDKQINGGAMANAPLGIVSPSPQLSSKVKRKPLGCSSGNQGKRKLSPLGDQDSNDGNINITPEMVAEVLEREHEGDQVYYKEQNEPKQRSSNALEKEGEKGKEIMYSSDERVEQKNPTLVDDCDEETPPGSPRKGKEHLRRFPDI